MTLNTMTLSISIRCRICIVFAAECRYAKCHYAECRVTIIGVRHSISEIVFKHSFSFNSLSWKRTLIQWSATALDRIASVRTPFNLKILSTTVLINN